MSGRLLRHVIFWTGFVMVYVMIRMLFAASSDAVYPFWMRVLRFTFSELAFLPWKIIPFYFLFYFLIPKYWANRQYLKIGIYFLGILLICLFGYRSMVTPVSSIMYGEIPEFNVFSFKRFLYSLTDILPALGLASTIKLLKGRIASDEKQRALEKEKLESELNFLKAQTNPHFLFNTMNNLYGLARKQHANTADSIMKLSNIMRFILQECSSDRIPIENEIKVIGDYIDLERLRYDDRLEVKVTTNIDDYQRGIAPLILLPFVENAFKHGASESRFESFIHIDLQLSNGHLQFKIINTVDAENPDYQEGVGLKNVKRQLDLIYGSSHVLDIYSDKDIFKVELSINLDSHA